MTRELKFGRVGAKSGETKSLVVFLHGYGANGADLLGLADPLGPHMPDTTFIAPDAPEACLGAPMGFQWFPVSWIDGSSEEAMVEGAENAHDDIDAFLDQMLEAEGLTPDKLVVFGFSQGAMLALKVLPQRPDPIAGIVACSGRILDPEGYADLVQSRPPVLLLHGDHDDVVPVGHFDEAGKVLNDADFDTYGHIMQGTGHGIAPDGLSVALTFMAQRLGIRLS
ncbi:MAG: phospholipase [Rhodobacterales bacterium]|nr:MAG: phospholipase [Rhodobacterales bacterium]